MCSILYTACHFYDLEAGLAAGASVSVQCAYRSLLARGFWILPHHFASFFLNQEL